MHVDQPVAPCGQIVIDDNVNPLSEPEEMEVEDSRVLLTLPPFLIFMVWYNLEWEEFKLSKKISDKIFKLNFKLKL